MKTVNLQSVTYTTPESVKAQVEEILRNKGYEVVNHDNLDSAFDEYYYSREIQEELIGKMVSDDNHLGEFEQLIKVIVFENYVDSGSEDYKYSVRVIEQ